jgi:putative transposase
MVSEITATNAGPPHMLTGVPGNAQLSRLIHDFKRITARMAKIDWQRNFFEHRLRHDESLAEKFEYICQNPVRAGLITRGEEWPYAIDASDLDPRAGAPVAPSTGD